MLVLIVKTEFNKINKAWLIQAACLHCHLINSVKALLQSRTMTMSPIMKQNFSEGQWPDAVFNTANDFYWSHIWLRQSNSTLWVKKHTSWHLFII